MEIVKGFFDYSVSEQCVNSSGYENTLKKLYKLGYRTVAINQTIEEGNLEPKKKKKKKGEPRDVSDVVPVPYKITSVPGCEELKVLNRLTVTFSNQDGISKIMKSPNYKLYHIIAVTPATQQALQFVCSSLDAEIFTYNPENKPPYKLNRKLYNQLAEKGYHFEISYSPAILDSSSRKNMIACAHLYHVYGKSKNVIMSSGAANSFLLRGPYDVINLGFIFGLSEGASKNAILNCGRNVFLRSIGRRNGKALMFVENIVEEKLTDSTTGSEDEEMDVEQPAQKKCKL